MKHLGLKLGSKSVHATKLSDTLSGGHLYDQAKKWNQGYIRTVQSIKIWLLFKKTSQLQRVCLLLVMLVMGGLREGGGVVTNWLTVALFGEVV